MPPYETGLERRGALHLTRLARLSDVVYAIAVWQLFMLIPTPDTEGHAWESIGSYLSDNGIVLLVVLVGVAWTVIYWLQSNHLFGVLRATDGVHSAYSIFQLFFLMIFLYSMKLGVDIGGTGGTWALESGSAMAVGLCASLAFARARKGRRLLHPDVTDGEARQMAIRYRAEPVTAGITIPFAFLPSLTLFGFNLTWEFSWFIYPLVVALARRMARQATA